MKELFSVLIVMLFVFGPQIVAGILKVRRDMKKQKELEAQQAQEAALADTEDRFPSSPGYSLPSNSFAGGAAEPVGLPPFVAAGANPPVHSKRSVSEKQSVAHNAKQNKPPILSPGNIIASLSTTDGAQAAFIASEVFRRPEERW